MKCANCGSERAGPYCGSCGQNDRNYQRALPPLLGDLLRETFEIDSRLLRTLKLLLLRPGALAVEFSENRRASYVSPIRLYLFVSLTFFFLLSITTDIEPSPGDSVQVTRELEAVAATDTHRLLEQMNDEQREKAVEIFERPDTSVARLALLQIAKGVEDSPEDLEELEVYLLGQLVDAFYEPGSMLDRLMDNLPIAIFIMLPVYALLLKIFYFGRHRYYVETLVFATHLHTFAFIVFTLLLLLPEEVGSGSIATALGWLSTLLWLCIAAYHYLALRNYFGGSHPATLFKFSGLMFVYTVMLLPAAFTIVLLLTVISI